MLASCWGLLFKRRIPKVSLPERYSERKKENREREKKRSRIRDEAKRALGQRKRERMTSGVTFNPPSSLCDIESQGPVVYRRGNSYQGPSSKPLPELIRRSTSPLVGKVKEKERKGEGERGRKWSVSKYIFD